MLAAGLAQRLAHGRCLAKGVAHRLRLRVEVVEDAQRAGGGLLARHLVETVGVLGEPGGQPLEIGRPALAAADGVQLEGEVRDSETPEERVVEGDHLGVDGRVLGADRLDGELPMLPEATALRRRVAMHRA